MVTADLSVLERGRSFYVLSFIIAEHVDDRQDFLLNVDTAVCAFGEIVGISIYVDRVFPGSEIFSTRRDENGLWCFIIVASVNIIVADIVTTLVGNRFEGRLQWMKTILY